MSEETKPSGALAGAAAILPSFFLMVACGSFALLMGRHGGSGMWHAVQATGVWFWGILAATMAAWVGVTVLLFLAARGMRVPAAITLFVAALPWLVGLAGVAGGVSMAADAVAYADPAERATLMSMGISEATNARLFGGVLGGALLASVAFGWALGAMAQRAEKRSVLGAVLGLGAALPLTGLAIYGAFAAWLPGVPLALAGMGAAIAVALAGWGAGDDAPHGRSAALAASAPIAAGLAVLASAAAASSASLIEVFRAIANADADSKSRLIGVGAMELMPLSWVLDLALPVALFTGAVVAGWAALRSKPSVGRVAGGAALVLAAGLVFALDAATLGWTSDQLEGASIQRWDDVAGVEPVGLPAGGEGGELDAAFTPSGLVDPAGGSLATMDEPALTAVLQRLREGRVPPRDAPDWGQYPDEETLGALALDAGPEVTLAVDRRVTGAQLRQLVRAANAANVRALELVGPERDGPTPAQAQAIRDTLPLLAIAIGGRGGVRVVLDGAIPPATSARDEHLHHVTVESAVPTRTEVRPGASVDAADRELGDRRRWDRYGEPARALYVAFADDTPADVLLETLSSADRSDFVPVLVAGDVPGDPETAALGALMGDPSGDDGNFGFGGLGLRGTGRADGDEGTIGLGNLGTIGHSGDGEGSGYGHGAGGLSGRGATTPRIRPGQADVRGSLSPEVIRRIVRRHIDEVRFCYEQQLSRNPGLEGRVTVSFIISPTGAVQAASVHETTLNDARVESCITNAVRRWRFPAPSGGGVVGVNYPFVLSPG